MKNTGADTLNVADITLTQITVEFYIFNPLDPPSPILPGDSAIFWLTFIPSANGIFEATVTIDSDEPDYVFLVRGEGGVTSGPDIYVSGGNLEIINGDTTPNTLDGTDFGGVLVGSSASNIINVDNFGDMTLNLGAATLSGSHASDFSAGSYAPFNMNPVGVLPAGGGTNFSLGFSPGAAGLRQATVTIPNNDPDEAPYVFDIQGIGTLNWYEDADGDNYGNPSVTLMAASQPTDYVLNNTDCDDSDPAVNPGATEVCNGIDDDCDGLVDNGLTFQDYYLDNDGDGFGAGAPVNACQSPGADYVLLDGDCDDGNFNINPGATELCNGIDDDCDGFVDNGVPTQTYYLDADLDGFGDPAVSLDSCAVPAGYVLDNTDCDDGNFNINPGATEVCNGIDDDCDGFVDNGLTFQDYYLDNDSDGYGTGAPVNDCQSPGANYELLDGDCDDTDPAINPGATEVCNGIDDDCDGFVDNGLTFQDYYLDNDGDGYGDGAPLDACQSPGTDYVLLDGDCDDTDPAINPGATEVCNGIDDDCDGLVDNGLTFQDYYLDNDGDGYGDGAPLDACQSPGTDYVLLDGDCDDTDPAINPAATEVCNGIDDDCDGFVDNGLTFQDYYLDGDGDGFGAGAPVNDCQSPGTDYVLLDGDCDDTDPAINPGATEVCNGIDDDCDGFVDNGVPTQTYYLDSDMDGFGDPAILLDSCAAPAGYVLDNTDCDDADPAVNPGATEVCNGIDDDCDGLVDNGVPTQTYYLDADLDGFGDLAVSLDSCAAPAGYVLDNTDCDDTNAAVNPGATELCNGIDDDCDGLVDNGVPTQTYYLDADMDGFGDPVVSLDSCAAPAGYVLDGTDCDDGNFNINPLATEVCNGVDDNCNGLLDNSDTALVDNIPPNVTCQNIAVTLNAAGTATIVPAEVFMSGADNCGTLNLQNVLPNTFDCSNIGDQNVTLTVNDGNGNTATCQAIITVSTNLMADAGASAVICEGQSTTLDASAVGGGGGFIFQWSPTAGLSETDIPNPVASPSQTTIYTVVVTDANGCTASASTTISVNPSPVATIAGVDHICLGESASLTAAGGASFLWSTMEVANFINVNPLVSTTYSVTVTAANGCADADTILVTVNALPMAMAGADVVFCESSNGAQLDASGSTGNGVLSFSWLPNQWLINSNTANPLASPPTDTFFIVIVTDVNGCEHSDTVAVSLSPSPGTTVGTSSPVCSNEDLSLNDLGTSAVQWAWVGPSGNLLGSSKNLIIPHSDVEEGPHFLIITDSSGCMDTTAFDVAFSAGIAFEAKFLTANVACAGDTVHFFEISQTADLPDAFFWNFGDGTVSLDRDPTHVYADAGTYQVAVVVTEAGCDNFSIEKEININDCRPNGGDNGILSYNLYPTVTAGRLRLELEFRDRDLLHINIFDAFGRLVESQTRRDVLHFNEEFMVGEPGIYFMQIRTLQGQLTLKFIVVRA